MIEPEANLEEEEFSDWMQPHGCNSMNGPIDPTLWMEPVDAALWMQNLWIQKSSDYEDNLKHDELNNLVRPPEKLHSTNLISDEPKPSLISSKLCLWSKVLKKLIHRPHPSTLGLR